ncbi:MAG: DUF4271 domain-containing protein [Bacteroidaceae bacterium]|nr:DUF4271 domain-containing protein [Bacteroidaceae bacterium]
MKAYDALPKSEATEPHGLSGFFNGNPLLHPELPYRTWGQSAMPVPYQLRNGDLATATLLFCLLILAYVVNQTRHQLAQQTHDFFIAPKERVGLFAVETSFENQARLLVILQLCLMCGLLALAYFMQRTDIPPYQTPPELLLAAYVGCFVAYFTAKRILSAFINWIFFPKSQQKLWNDSNSYLISVESILIFPLTVFSIYLDISAEKILLFFLFILISVKILLAYKALKIFFQKIYGLFHLFAYLCTLELMPMLILWKALGLITDNLIVKY